MNKPILLTNRQLFADKNLKLIFSITLAGTMGVSLITPVLPSIIDAFNITKSQVSWVIIAYTLPGLLFSPFHGAMSDKWGRKAVLVPLLFLFGIAGFLSGFAETFGQLLVLRFLQGIGGSGIFTLNHALVGDLYRGKTRMQIMGINAAMINIGTAIFPIMGGYLGGMGWRYPFHLYILAVAVGFLILFKLENMAIPPKQSMSGYMKQAFASIRHWKIIRLYILSFTTFLITFGAMIAYLPLLMSDKFGSSPFSIGLVMACGSLSSALISANIGRLGRFVPANFMVATAFGLYTIAFGWIIMTHSAWHLLLISAMFGFGQGLNIPNVQTILVSSAPEEVRGLFMAFNSMIILIGITLGPVIASIIYNFWGISHIYLFAGVLTFVFMLWLIFYSKDMNI